ncbi:MAG: hypothetical protein KC708_01095 [Anaerolineae bacterium]|nr:hypothetical protein [Anaerolineae bacterium]
MRGSQTPGLVFQPDAYHALQRGIHQMVSAIRPTLGPTAGGVAIDPIHTTQSLPEYLDDGGIIARRIIELQNRDVDMGAMLVRSLLVRQNEVMGDGTATTAVLLEAIFNAGLRYIAAGGNAMKLRRNLEKAIPVLQDALAESSFTIAGEEQLTRVAQSHCHDEEMARLMGEAFDLIGEYGRLEIREDYGRVLRHEYVQGTYYYSNALSTVLFPAGSGSHIELENPSVFVCNFEITDHRELFPVLKAAHDAGLPSLIIATTNMSDAAISLLTTNNSRLDTFKVMAVKLPGLNATDRMQAVEDISLLTGATPLIKEAGDTLERATADTFGKARRIWVDKHTFGLVGGRGDKRKLIEHLERLKRFFHTTHDLEERERTRKRIANLQGGSVTLWVGGFTEPEIAHQKSIAERTRQSMYRAMQGVVLGGGMGLLACRKALEQQSKTTRDADERAVYTILWEALAAPARTIWRNAGYDPSHIMAKLQFKRNGIGFDVVSGQMVDMVESGIVDSLSLMQSCVRNAISTAALALTVDVLVHVANPEMIGKPE